MQVWWGDWGGVIGGASGDLGWHTVVTGGWSSHYSMGSLCGMLCLLWLLGHSDLILKGLHEGCWCLATGDSCGEEVHELSVEGFEAGGVCNGMSDVFKLARVSLAAGGRVEGRIQTD